MTTIDLEKITTCKDGLAFVQSKSSLIEAWNTCERGDWMLWAAHKLDCPLQLLTLAKAKCAETVIHLMKDERSINAVKVAIDFGNGRASREELDAAYCAVYAAADAATDAAYCAVYAAADAADAAADAASASAAAASSHDADSASASAAADAEKENQLQTANVCREILTDFIKSKIL